MKNLTIAKALEIGFDFENSSSETIEELNSEIMEFLNENTDLLPVIEEECEVSQSGRNQTVNHGDFTSSGEIINYGMWYWTKPADEKYFHSDYLFIDENGNPFKMCLFQFVGENEWNTDREETQG